MADGRLYRGTGFGASSERPWSNRDYNSSVVELNKPSVEMI